MSSKARSEHNKIALVMCICNEANALEEHLRYHHLLGVSRAYIFLDHCTDNSEGILRQFPWVTVFDYPRPESCPGLPAYQEDCAKRAFEMARHEGFDWLMHIDPDEFAWADNTGDDPASRGDLHRMLAQVSSEIDLVHLLPKEVLPLKLERGTPYWYQCYFQHRPHILKREILDPTSNQIRTLEKWAGHNIGKSIIRTDRNVVPDEAHSWKRPGAAFQSGSKDLKIEHLGCLYHYVFKGPIEWREKYQKLAWEPDTWIVGGKVPFPKQAWKEASIQFSPKQATEYYNRWVVIDEAFARDCVQQGTVVHETSVRDILQSLL